MSSWVYAAKPPRGKTREEAGMHGRPVGAPEFTWGRMIGKALRYVGIDRGRWQVVPACTEQARMGHNDRVARGGHGHEHGQAEQA